MPEVSIPAVWNQKISVQGSKLLLLNYFHASSTVTTCFLSVVASAVVGWMRLSVSLWGELMG